MWLPLKRNHWCSDQFEQFDHHLPCPGGGRPKEQTVAVEGPGRRPVKLGLLLLSYVHACFLRKQE
jgi:hypothetical protein